MRAFQSGAFQLNAFQIVEIYAVISFTLDDVVFVANGSVASNTLAVALDDITFKTATWLTDYLAASTWTDQANPSATWTDQPNL
jgi:hypothetical protein